MAQDTQAMKQAIVDAMNASSMTITAAQRDILDKVEELKGVLAGIGEGGMTGDISQDTAQELLRVIGDRADLTIHEVSGCVEGIVALLNE